MNGQPTQKRCPQCQTVVDILTQQCPGCGHWFRTQFQQQPINQTTVIPPMGVHVINAPATYVQPRQEHSILAAFLLAMFLPFLVHFYNKQVWKGVAFIFAGGLYAGIVLGWYTTLAMAMHPALVLIPTIIAWALFMVDAILCASALKVIPKFGDWAVFGGGYAPRGTWQFMDAWPYLIVTGSLASLAALTSVMPWVGSTQQKPEEPPYERSIPVDRGQFYDSDIHGFR